MREGMYLRNLEPISIKCEQLETVHMLCHKSRSVDDNVSTVGP